jgi:hypothetical protein
MKLLSSHMTTEQTNRRQEQKFRMALKRGGFVGLGKRQGKSVKGVLVCWAGNQCVRERGQVSESHVVGDEGGEVTEGNQDIRAEAGECPERAYFVP